MSVSAACNVNVTNMELTPMLVKFNGADLGGTRDNVVISIEVGKSEIRADQLGETTLDRRISKQTYKVTTKLVEIRDMSIIKVAFPHMHLVSSGGSQGMFVNSQIGLSDQANAGVLSLHPLSLALSDISNDWTFYKAIPSEVSEFVYGPTEQTGVKVEWLVLPDLSSCPQKFFIYGDPALPVEAGFSPAVSGGGNVGDGDVSNIQVIDGSTLDETITLTAIGPNDFTVSGSSSGSQAQATVGLLYSNPYIYFLINAGATPFQSGDTFTIDTTASNFS